MSYDAKILSACITSRHAYERVRNFIEDGDLSPTAGMWWPLIVNWYARDEAATAIDPALLRERGKRELPPNHHATLLGFYDDLPPAPSPENVVVELLELKRFLRRAELMQSLQSNKPEAAREAWAAYDRLVEAVTLDMYDDRPLTLEQAFEQRKPENLIRLAPMALQERIQGIGAGETMVLFGRPEIGKSLFSVGIACRAARDGHKVLYLGNEEPVGKTMLRCLSNLLDRPTALVQQHEEEAKKVGRQRGIDRIVFRQLEPGSVHQIEHFVGKDKPRLVIVDQVRNIQSKGQTLTTRLEEVQQALRAMASRYGFAVVSITQAGDSGENKVYLDMGDIDSSNTGIQGACDALVGVGADAQMKNSERRGVSLPKNKLGHTHEGFLVTIDRARNKIQ